MTILVRLPASLVSRLRWVPLLLAGLGLLLAACGGDEGSGVSCAPGEILACTCDDGSSGSRICDAEGTAHGDCQCASLQDTAGGTDGGDAGEPGKDGGDTCKPDCAGRECGDDGCGGSCGACQWGACVEGLCSCTPDCKDKVCGPDACGGSCGTCAAGTHCSVRGACEDTDPCQEMTNPYCCAADKVWTCMEGALDIFEDCGASETTCGVVDLWDWVDVDCGALDEVLPLSDPAVTFAPACPGCVADCGGKECGTDGCGGLCAPCPTGRVCDLASFTCVDCVPACADRERRKRGRSYDHIDPAPILRYHPPSQPAQRVPCPATPGSTTPAASSM